LLAKNIYLRQQNISKEHLNYAVQKIIDRIIFLRVAEDRDIQTFASLQNHSANYEQLCKLFKEADHKYNAGLFHFSNQENRGEPDIITPHLKIDTKIIKDIINPLYDGCVYNFYLMPTYILGSVYERFLGKEVNIENKKINIALKPEVRKAGGVYYTPEYIVEYIVQNTIHRNEHIKILDPACGSGSFLLVAYQYMLDYHQKNQDEKFKLQKKPTKKLTILQKKQILLDHIFGVDIDEQAVEVTKLSLLLKVLEDVTTREADKLENIEYLLPSLHNNIKCGNSLIDDPEIAGEKAFV
jgi:type I restriction-modification system DNA methylase subunit